MIRRNHCSAKAAYVGLAGLRNAFGKLRLKAVNLNAIVRIDNRTPEASS
jgi:hypothetical protein